MSMHSLPQIEKIIRDNAPLFKKTHIPETIQFKLNLIRKNSPHVALGLVVVDEKENPYFVIKIPQQISKVCDEAIEREYKFLNTLKTTHTTATPPAHAHTQKNNSHNTPT